MTIKKGEFVEIEFTGFSEEGKVFDTNIEEVAKKNSMYNEEDKEKFKPLKICIGEGMLVKGFDKALEGKETEKEYKISLEPNEAFGIRNKDMIKTVSINSFKQQGFMPVAGMVVSLDNMLARIAAVSGGRVIIDFNNPLSGKKVNYEFKILKKINDDKEKIEMIINNSLGLPAEIEIIEGEKQKAKITLEFQIPEQIKKELNQKIKDLIGIELEFLVKAKEAEKEQNNPSHEEENEKEED